jgi:organic hydroperoxide reductase OsmC/OhrA
LDVAAGKFTEATLCPMVTVTESWMIDKANALHLEANKKCFIANSCNFNVKHLPSCVALNNAI